MGLLFTTVEQTLVNVTPLRRRLVLRMLGRSDEDDPELNHGEILFLWLVNLLVQAAPLTDDQVTAVLEEYKNDVILFGQRLEQPEEKMPVAILTVLDRTWVSLSGRDNFLDLKEGKLIKALGQSPLESVSYNLSTLYSVSMARLMRRQRQEET